MRPGNRPRLRMATAHAVRRPRRRRPRRPARPPHPSRSSRPPGPPGPSRSMDASTSRSGRRSTSTPTSASATPRRASRPPRRRSCASSTTTTRSTSASGCSTREPLLIGRRLSRRDEPADGDRFTLFLDPRHDRLTGVRFEVSAAGVQRDEIIFNDTWSDDSWDAVWESAVSVDDARAGRSRCGSRSRSCASCRATRRPGASTPRASSSARTRATGWRSCRSARAGSPRAWRP